jgi:hypothetical protein
MQILTFHGEVATPKVINAEIRALGSLAVIAQRLEMEGAKILSRNSSHISFRGGLRAKFIASKWSFLLIASSGKVNTFVEDEKVVASYKICFDEWALIVLILFIIIGLIFMYSFAQGSADRSYLSNVYCLAPISVLAVGYFGLTALLAITRFRGILHSCLIETNQLV